MVVGERERIEVERWGTDEIWKRGVCFSEFKELLVAGGVVSVVRGDSIDVDVMLLWLCSIWQLLLLLRLL